MSEGNGNGEPRAGSVSDLARRVGNLEGQVGTMQENIADLRVSVAGIAGAQTTLTTLISTNHGQAMGAIGALATTLDKQTAGLAKDREDAAAMIAEADKSPAGRALLSMIEPMQKVVDGLERRYWIGLGVTIGTVLAAPALRDAIAGVLAVLHH